MWSSSNVPSIHNVRVMHALLVTTACWAWTPHTLSITPTPWRQPVIVASASPGEWWRRAARRGGRNERRGQAAAGPFAPSSSDESTSGDQRRVFVPWLLNSYAGELVELAVTLILALSPLWIGFFASQLISAYAIPSRSMDETLKVGDVVVAEKVSSLLHLPLERGDLIFFRPPQELSEIVAESGLRVGARDRFVKRVAAIAGDRVQLDETGRTVLINGVPRAPPPLACPSEPPPAHTLTPVGATTSAAGGIELDETSPRSRAGGIELDETSPRSRAGGIEALVALARDGDAYGRAAASSANALTSVVSSEVDAEVVARVQAMLDAGKVSRGEAAALLREVSPPARESAEGAAEAARRRASARIFGNVEQRAVDPRLFSGGDGAGVGAMVGGAPPTLTIRKGEVFVLGDCEARSTDSRAWGPLAESAVVARPVVRVWPLDRYGPIETTADLNPFRRALEQGRRALEQAAFPSP